MGGQFRLGRHDRVAACGAGVDIDRHRPTRVLRRQRQPALAAAGQLDIDLGQQLAVQQRVVGGARRQVDGEPPAQRVQAVRHPGKPGFRQRQRVDHPVPTQRRQAGAAELHVQEAEVERRVVRDQLAVAEELRQRLGDLGEQRLARPGRRW